MDFLDLDINREYEVDNAVFSLESSKDRRTGVLIAFTSLTVAALLLYFISSKIPTPPLPETLLFKDAEMELIPLEAAIAPEGNGGGGSGTPVDAKVVQDVIPQTEEMLTTSEKSPFNTPSGKSNHTNTTKPNNNGSSTTQKANNPFGGSGGSGGGNTGGNGKGIGKDNGDGKGPGTGKGEGGNVKRFYERTPNTSNIKNEDFCKISLKVSVDANGNVISVRVNSSGTTTNNQSLINQVRDIVKSELKYNKVDPKTPVFSDVISITIQPN
jgi:hypothetical protein